MTKADRIRAHVVERYVAPARSRCEETITVVAGAVLRDLELRGDYAPSVCSALRATWSTKRTRCIRNSPF